MEIRKPPLTLLIIIACTVISCNSYKKSFVHGAGSIEQAIMNVIIDYESTYKKPLSVFKKKKGYNVFKINRNKCLNEKLFIVSIIPQINSYSVYPKDKIDEVPREYFPNKFYILNDDLFLWNDGKTPLNNELIDVMHKFGVIDSSYLKMNFDNIKNKDLDDLQVEDLGDTSVFIIDDRLESYDYFICKKDISNFKKIITWKAFGYYDIPELNCN